jgi:hypothetical protein
MIKLVAGRQGLGFLQMQEIFVYVTASKPPFGSTQSPIQWVPGATSSKVKRPGREAGHSSPSSAEGVEIFLQSPLRLHAVVFS